MTKASPFIGRKEDLQDLNLLFQKTSASLVVVQGRRRIGKSRLIQEFGSPYQFFQFTGLPPNAATTAQSQRNEFMRQFNTMVNLPEMQLDDWGKIFFLLNREIKPVKTVILLDEISWMGSKDSDFLGKLKNAWDLYFKQHPQLVLVLCGSVSTWIERNILSHTGFLGRISLRLTVGELPLKDCNQFLTQKSKHISAYEKFKILTITGGIPRYLEEVQPGLSAEENIKRLCFSKKGILFNECNNIFADLFSDRSEFYKNIIKLLVDGKREFNDICQELSMPKSGHISEYLENLIQSRFITRDYTWNLRNGKESRLSHYRLSDNYLRFYLKYIEKNRNKIERGHFDGRSLLTFPGWESIMGLQFENLALNNRKKIWEQLSIYPEDIICDNPFFQRKTTRSPGCQIDYLIQTRFNTLYVCEIKFSKNVLDVSIIDEVQQKLNRLKIPKNFSCRSVLIHVNGVNDNVLENEFFSHLVDFKWLLENE